MLQWSWKRKQGAVTLPRGHRVTQRIVKEVHEKSQHAGGLKVTHLNGDLMACHRGLSSTTTPSVRSPADLTDLIQVLAFCWARGIIGLGEEVCSLPTAGHKARRANNIATTYHQYVIATESILACCCGICRTFHTKAGLWRTSGKEIPLPIHFHLRLFI